MAIVQAIFNSPQVYYYLSDYPLALCAIGKEIATKNDYIDKSRQANVGLGLKLVEWEQGATEKC